LGTAGPIRLARDLILTETISSSSENSSEESKTAKDYCPFFFVFNSDIICEFPLQ
jgi:NDP-sugar pyrophosphorylase family protein